MIVSFDFDDTLRRWDGTPCVNMIKHARELIKSGSDIIIVTARKAGFENHDFIVKFCREHDIAIKRVICVNHELKGPHLKKANAEIHYDDSIDHCHSAIEHGVRAYLVQNDCIVHVYPLVCKE